MSFTQGQHIYLAEHKHIHQGRAYVASEVNSLADDEYLSFLMFLPTSLGENAHSTFGFRGTGDFQVVHDKAPTVADSGTTLLIVPRNDAMINSADGIRMFSVTSYTAGTNRFDELVPGGSSPLSSGGGAELRDEWICVNNTVYGLKLTNVSGGAGQFGLRWNFYTHP